LFYLDFLYKILKTKFFLFFYFLILIEKYSIFKNLKTLKKVLNKIRPKKYS